MTTNMKWNGREVRNPIARVLLTGIGGGMGLIIGGFALCLVMLGLVVALVAIAISLPLHVVLRLIGCKGFYSREGNSQGYNISGAGFRRAR